MKKFYFQSLYSCHPRKQNTDKYKKYLQNENYVLVNEQDADDIFIWTCAFRQDAKQHSINKIREFRKKYPDKNLYICGCMPAIDSEVTAQIAQEVNATVIPWKEEENFFDKNKLNLYDDVLAEPPICTDVEQYKKLYPNKPISFADQFIKLCISEGCNCDCAYCSEKLAFPKYKSFAPDVLAESLNTILKTSPRRGGGQQTELCLLQTVPANTEWILAQILQN